MPITVGNDDIDNVIVTTSVGATARGVVRDRRRLGADVPRRIKCPIFPQPTEPGGMT